MVLPWPELLKLQLGSCRLPACCRLLFGSPVLHPITPPDFLKFLEITENNGPYLTAGGGEGSVRQLLC